MTESLNNDEPVATSPDDHPAIGDVVWGAGETENETETGNAIGDAPERAAAQFDLTPPEQPLVAGALPLWRRIGSRIIRRPLAWVDAPWTLERALQSVTAALFLITTFFITRNVVHWDLVTTNNTPTGGDMGAHVMAPAYLRDHLLDNLRISGWSPYWYNGFPLYRFYMVIPGLMIVLLNTVLPYGIAFKIIVVSGIMTLPVCCWAFGRLAKFAYPIPELFSLGAIVFLLDESFAIYGGNLKSTMAGEFSFSIALSFAMLGLGLFAHGLETGKYRGRTAVIISLAMLSHGIVAIFVLIALALMWLMWMDRQRLVYGLTTLIPAGLIGAFWLVPFALGTPYMTDMKYGKRPEGANDSYWKMFFNLDVTFDRIIFVLAVIGFFAAIARRHLNGVWLGITVVALAVFTRLAENSLPIIGLLWNPRVLPFFYLLRYLLMMVGIAEVGRGVTWLVTRARVGHQLSNERKYGHSGLAVGLPTNRGRVVGATVTGVTALFAIGLMLLISFEQVPGGIVKDGRYIVRVGTDLTGYVNLYQKRACDPAKCTRDAQGDGWSRYNFTGYEDKGAYGEYRSLVTTMGDIGKDPAHGCGRALWENNGDNGKYGTTMSLMLLPHWTDGCIASSEGLFFEASGTTPYHFITAAAMSSKSSNPVRQLRYLDNDPAVGVPYLQKLGIRYYMAWTDLAVAKAETQPGLTQIARVGPWRIYEVAKAEIIESLTIQPVVVNSRTGDPRERWLELGTSWLQNPTEWAAMPAGDGPAEWQRIKVDIDMSRRQGALSDHNRKVDIVTPQETIVPQTLSPVTVTNPAIGNESVDFDVDQIGVPVLVKVSYFPNWTVEGAKGPYRIAPNQMVVIPTSKHVHMSFGRSTTDLLAYMLSVLGLFSLWLVKRLIPIRYRSIQPAGIRNHVDPELSSAWTPRQDLATEPADSSTAAPDLEPWPDPDPEPEVLPDRIPEPVGARIEKNHEKWSINDSLSDELALDAQTPR